MNKVYFETLSSPDGTEDVAEFENAELILKDLDLDTEYTII